VEGDVSEKGLVLVTGGAGFIAKHCIKRLLEDGWRVRATVRTAARAQRVRIAIGGAADDPARLSFVAADLNADAGWDKAVEHCHFVLHVASPFPITNPRNELDLIAPARDGTLRVLRAARDESVRRVVVTSSIAAIAYGRGGRTEPFTEEDWTDETNRKDTTAYERSKTIAERAAWAFMEREGGALQMTTINPSAVIGPTLDAEASASLELVRLLLTGAIPGCPRLSFAMVDVRDVADLHVRAMTAPEAAGKRFIAAGPVLSIADVARILHRRVPVLARKAPRRELPDLAVKLAALFDPVVRERVFELGVKRPVSSKRAQSLLGWTQRDVERSIEDTARSLVEFGIVRV
jgi:dihydroflavonol-4-reductase